MAFRNYLEGEDDKPYFHLNSLAHYYEEMQRYAALIKEMTGYIKDYGNELGLTKEEINARLTAYILENKEQLDQRLGEWDEKLHGSVADLLAEWVDDGTLTHIIDTTLIDEKIQPIATQLTKTEVKSTENQRANNYYWNPEPQPPARKDLPGYFSDGYNYTPEDYIALNFEPIRLKHTDYITRTLLGKDTSGNHDIWRYELTPKKYSKTIILSTVLHGGEVTPMLAMARFLHYLTEEYEKYPALAYIRENVRIIYTPIVNPWGLNQMPRTRHNSNGVDINRNFSKYWDTFDPNKAIAPFSFGHKGVAPFSEKETQYVRDTLAAYPTAIAYFDFHNTGAPTNYDFFYVTPSGYHMQEFDRLVEYYSKGMTDPVIFNDTALLPNACNYTYDTYRIPTAHPEWCDMRRGLKTYDVIEMTGAVAWFSNIIIEFCRNYEKEPFAIEGYYSGNGTTNQLYLNVGTAHAEIEQFRVPIKIGSHGLLKVTYDVVMFNADLTATNYIAPVIEQPGTDVYTVTTGNSEMYSTNTARSALTVTTTRFVYPTEGTIGEAVVKLFGRTTAGSNVVSRVRMHIEFTPLSEKKNYKLLNATGRELEKTNAFNLLWRT